MTPIPNYLVGQVQWAPVQVPSNFSVSSMSAGLAQWKVPPPEAAFFQQPAPNQLKSSPLNLLEPLSASTSALADKQGTFSMGSPFDYEESYYTNMYRQLANRYNPQYKNKKPVHVAINQRTVNGLLSLLLLFVVSVCGSTGAVLIISSLTVIESLQTRNNCHLVSLALTNLLVTLLVIPTSALQIMTGDTLDGHKICHYQWLLLEHSLLVSQLSFFFMAADNYLGYQCSQKVAINATNIEEPNKLNQNLSNLLVCDHPLVRSTTTTMQAHRGIHNHQPTISDTDVLLNNTTDLLWPAYGKGEFTRPGYLGYRFCCGRLKVPVWIICSWLIAVTCTLHQHESRYGPEFCSSAAAQSQRLNTSNNHGNITVQGIAEQSIREPLMVSSAGQEVQTLEDKVVATRVARGISIAPEPYYFERQPKNIPVAGSAFLKPEVNTKTEDTFTLNAANMQAVYSSRKSPDDWHESQQNTQQLEKPELEANLEIVDDSCHRNKCKPDAASRMSSRDVARSDTQHLAAASRVVGGKSSMRSPQRDSSNKKQLSGIQAIKRADDSHEKLEATLVSHKGHLQELVHHIWDSWFTGHIEAGRRHKKEPNSHTRWNKRRDLNGLFMNNNNNNSNDDNNVGPMQIARERRTVGKPMYIGPSSTNDGPSTYLGSSHFSSNTANQQPPPASRLRQIKHLGQQLATKLKPHEASTTTDFLLVNNLPVKQWQFVDRSIGTTSQLSSGNNSTTSGLPTNKPPEQAARRTKQWLLLLTISSVTSLMSALLFAGSYLKMKSFKMRPYKPMPVDAMNAFVASLLSSSNNAPHHGDSPCPSASSTRLTPEMMTPLEHPQWYTKINTGRPTSALPPLDPPAAPAGYPALRSVSQPCGPTQAPGIYGTGAASLVEQNSNSTWNRQQRRQLNQALSAPGGAVVSSSAYLSPPTHTQTSLNSSPPNNLQNSTPTNKHLSAPVYPSVPVSNEQAGPQKGSASAQMSQHVSSLESAQLAGLERHRSLPPQSRASSGASRWRQDRKLHLDEDTSTTPPPIQYKRAKAIKMGADQLHVPGETNNNGASVSMPRSASSPHSNRGEPEVSVCGSSNGAASKQHYNRAIICTYSYMTDEQLLKSNIIAFVVNLTLWMPLILLTVVIEPRQPHQQPSQELKDFVWWMATLNCCSCSYVYALTNKDFREAFNKLFYYCCCKSHVTFQKKTPIFRRQLDLDPNCNLRVHIIPGLNQFSSKLSRPQ